MPKEKAGNNAVALARTGEIVAARLKGFRTSNNLSYIALEAKTEALGRRVPAISLRRIEDGTRRVDVDDLFVLARALEISPSDLLTGSSNALPYGTSIPEDVAFQEFTAWIGGTLKDFSARSRWHFWQKVYITVGKELPGLREQSNKWANLGDSEDERRALKGVAENARRNLENAENSVAEATKHLERLQIQLDAEE